MRDLLLAIQNRADFWAFIAIPFVAALVGWLTSWLAMTLSLRPLVFTGLRAGGLGLGWQGLLPARAAAIAGLAIDNSLARQATLTDMFRQMQPERIAEHIAGTINADMEDYVDEIMSERDPVLWENVPIMVKKRVYARARRQMPDIMDNIVDDLAASIEELVDLRDMVVSAIAREPALLVRSFQKAGQGAWVAAARSGLWLGLALGLLQMAAWWQLPAYWLLPVAGCLTGGVVVWLAFAILRGRLHRRQPAFADSFSAIGSEEIINLRQVMAEVLTGARAYRTRAIIRRHMRPLLESGVVRTAIQLALGAEGYADLKNRIADRAVAMSLGALSDSRFIRERSGIMHGIFRERMTAMSAAEFRALLRLALQDGVWPLVLLGGVLGGIAGGAQLLVLLSL